MAHESKIYRPCRAVRNEAILGIVFFLLFIAAPLIPLVLQLCSADGRIEKYAIRMALIGLVFWGTMLLLSVLQLLYFYISTLTVTNSSLTLRSLRGVKHFNISDVTSLKWREVPRGGSVLVRGASGKFALYLGGYSKEDRLDLIRGLRHLIPVANQIGWPKFCHKIALSLRDRKPSILREDPTVVTVTVTRGRYDRFFILLLLICFVHAMIWAFLLKYWEIMLIVPIVLMFWVIFRFSIPSAGKIDVESRPSNRSRAGMLCLGIFFFSPLVLSLIFWSVDWQVVFRLWAILSYGSVLGAMFLFGQFKLRSKKAIEGIHQRALIEWDEGERWINSTPC